MKSNIISTFLRGGQARKANKMSRAKFQSMLKEEKSVEKLRLDDDRVNWGEDRDFHNVETLKIGSVRVPDQWFNLVSDPAGYKGRRDIKHLKMVERLQKKERIKTLKKKTISSQKERPTRINHQLKLSEKIKNTLNDILSNEVNEFPDPVLEGSSQKDTIVNTVLHLGAPRFINVAMTRDLKIARCTWESLPNYETQVRDQLTMIKIQLRRMLAARVKMRHVPKLEFHYNEKKAVSQDVERLLNRMEDRTLEINKRTLDPAIMKQGKLTDEERNQKLKYYLDSLYHFQVTRQTILSPFEEKLQKSLQDKLVKKETSKRVLFEKEKLKRIQRKNREKEKSRQ